MSFRERRAQRKERQKLDREIDSQRDIVREEKADDDAMVKLVALYAKKRDLNS